MVAVVVAVAVRATSLHLPRAAQAARARAVLAHTRRMMRRSRSDGAARGRCTCSGQPTCSAKRVSAELASATRIPGCRPSACSCSAMRPPACSAMVSLPLRTPRTPSPRPFRSPSTCVCDHTVAQASASWRFGGFTQRQRACPRRQRVPRSTSASPSSGLGQHTAGPHNRCDAVGRLYKA